MQNRQTEMKAIKKDLLVATVLLYKNVKVRGIANFWKSLNKNQQEMLASIITFSVGAFLFIKWLVT